MINSHLAFHGGIRNNSKPVAKPVVAHLPRPARVVSSAFFFLSLNAVLCTCTRSDNCEQDLKNNPKGGLKGKGELDTSGSDSEAEQDSDHSDTQCESDIGDEVDLELDDEDVVEWEADDVETEEEEKQEEAKAEGSEESEEDSS